MPFAVPQLTGEKFGHAVRAGAIIAEGIVIEDGRGLHELFDGEGEPNRVTGG